MNPGISSGGAYHNDRSLGPPLFHVNPRNLEAHCSPGEAVALTSARSGLFYFYIHGNLVLI